MNTQLINFNPEISAVKLKSLWGQREKLSLEIVQELYKAKEFYSNSGFRNDLRTNVQRLNTFGDYLEYAGFQRRTSDRWLERYIPEENKLLTHEEYKEKKQIGRQEKQKEAINNFDYDAFNTRKEKYFAEHNRCSETKVTDQEEIKKLLDDADKAIKQEQIKDEKIKKLRITCNNEIIDQEIWFESFRDYINQFENQNRRLEIIQNFIKYLKSMAIDCQRSIKAV